MGLAFDTIAAYKANPGATVSAAAATSGDSLTVRAFSRPSTAQLLWLARQGAAAGKVGLRSPLFHDNTSGIRAARAAGLTSSLIPRSAGQQLQATDTLIAELTGGTAETDALAYAVYYSDLGGAQARLLSPGDVMGRVVDLKTVPVSVSSSSGAATGWDNTLITATEDLLHANKDYAVLGYLTDVAQLAIGVKGTDTANLKICGPGLVDSTDTYEYFVRASEYFGMPMIPVFNQANKGSTYVVSIDAAGSAAPNITLLCAELAS